MKLKMEDLKKMSKKDLLETYRQSKTSVKKKILKNLTNSYMFAVLMDDMSPKELEQMAKIYPYKERIVDKIIENMENHRIPMDNIVQYFNGNDFQRESFNKFMDTIEHKSLFTKIKEKLTRKPALPESLPKKIEHVKKLCEVEKRRKEATGKKMETLETQGLDQAVDESRVEVDNGEMVKAFDRCARENYKNKEDFKKDETKIKIKAQLTEKYISILGSENRDVAKLVANAEFESYSGEPLYVPYDNGLYTASSFPGERGYSRQDEGWRKNFLEVEKVEDFTVSNNNLGEVFVVKSEFQPTAYAIQGKWAPIYEYYAKDENGEFIRIGSGKINKRTGKMETTISTNRKDISNYIKKNTDEIEKGKQDGQILQFDSSKYAGKSVKTSRKDIEQAITTKSIQTYLGKGKQIVDITQVRDMKINTYDDKKGSQTKNAYVIACVENGIESYEMVCIGEDGKCQTYPGVSQDRFAKKDLYFPTGNTTGNLWILDEKQALETFKSKDGIQYSAYRDKDGNLRVAQLMDRASGSEKYAEELDTYSLMHGDIEKVKAQSKEEYDRARTLQKVEQSNLTASLNLDNKNNNILSL